jgi:hypothetical protein
MGRVRIPAERTVGRPSGPRWSKYRRLVIARWAGRPCYYCGHGFAAPQLIEVCHLISPILRPDLAWNPGNLVPGHGAGKRRCPHRDENGELCDLNCNWLAHNSPDAIKNEAGQDMPFTPQFLARQAKARAQFRRQLTIGRHSSPGQSAIIRANPRNSSGNPASPAGSAAEVTQSDESPGRVW